MPVRTVRLRVLMTADAVGGVWPYAVDLADGLSREGVEVTLALLGPPASDAQRAQAEAAGCRLIDTGLPLDWLAETPDAVLAAGEALARLAGLAGADLVHLHSPAFAAAGGFDVPVVAVCHSCVATWWWALEPGPLPPDLAWRRDLVALGCERADALLAPSAAFAAATAGAYGLPRQPTVVRNGRRTPAWPNSPDDAGHYPARYPAPFAFTAGRLWDRAKNVAALDRVAALSIMPVRAAGPTEGPHGERIRLIHLARLGPLDDAGVAAQLRERPVFVSLARYEPFGLAVLEAAQAGCALVLSDIPTFRELWDGAAVFVDPAETTAAAGILDALATDSDRHLDLGDAARAHAARYGMAAATAGVLRAFETVLTGRRLAVSLDGAAA
ncbi:glycosyltransferase family 4 protein [uncultured Methylobacterium sp.]|uniref:glycosyltransferase family 4 protein n=1 Tax=uncultured Methylobacterium sp. TaxID=157278 RepID=UPI0035CA4E70